MGETSMACRSAARRLQAGAGQWSPGARGGSKGGDHGPVPAAPAQAPRTPAPAEGRGGALRAAGSRWRLRTGKITVSPPPPSLFPPRGACRTRRDGPEAVSPDLPAPKPARPRGGPGPPGSPASSPPRPAIPRSRPRHSPSHSRPRAVRAGRAGFAAGAVRNRGMRTRRLPARRPSHTRRPFSSVSQS